MLVMLVSAFAGWEQMLTAYRHGVASGYRFLSMATACSSHE
jgi:S-adenosylmethionine:tRNA-ribosyltransferase-isomerase (queuine synthetase)